MKDAFDSPKKTAQLPVSLNDVTDAVHLFDSEEVSECRVVRAVFEGNRLTHRFVQSVLFEECTFRDFRMSESHFTDVVFRNCDLSNDFLSGCNFLRVEFIGCRLIGTDFSAGRFRQVLVDNCLADYANFSEGQFRQILLRTVSCREAAFANCRLEQVRFLGHAEFYRTAMKGLDVTDSEIPGLQVTAVDSFELRGLRVTPHQALDLVRMLGVKIE